MKALFFLIAAGVTQAAGAAVDVRVGSKVFTESVILGDIALDAALAAGLTAHHDKQLGGTQILWKALLRGDLDVYPDYTGTIITDIFSGASIGSYADLAAALAKRGIGISPPLGFDNTYALGMLRGAAARLGIRTISDLRSHPDLLFGLSHEFIDRPDGWPALTARYELRPAKVEGIDHALAYQALSSGKIAVTDLYTTDAKIAYYGLTTLTDDLRVFPRYDAVYLYRLDGEQRYQGFVGRLLGLAGKVDTQAMMRMNARVEIDGDSEESVARAFAAAQWPERLPVGGGPSLWSSLWQRTKEHLTLVGISLLGAVIVALPLGVIAAWRQVLGQIIMGLSGVIQTVPALALLVMLIPSLGIGFKPAIAALFVYSLLPIVRNTVAGLRDIAVPLKESAVAIGLPPLARLRLVELPLALRSILAGIKTSAVINVGNATLGALVGADGYGQPILAGIRRDDFGLILQGAVPAALLAILMQGIFELLERWLVPRGLRGDVG